MRQVDEAELVWNLKLQIARLPVSVRKGLTSNVAETRRTHEQIVAEALVRGALGRYEVLSDAPLPPGSDLFTRAAYELGDGSAPSIEA